MFKFQHPINFNINYRFNATSWVLRYQDHSYLLTVLLFQHLFQTQYLMFYSTYQRVTPLLTTVSQQQPPSVCI